MQTHVLLLFLLFFFSPGFKAQQTHKTAIKLDKLYKNKTQKCINKCRKNLDKGKYKNLSYYYLSLCYYKKYLSDKKDKHLLKTVNYQRRFFRSKDQGFLVVDSAVLNRIQFDFERLVNRKIAQKKMGVAKRYAKNYRRVYGVEIDNQCLLTQPKKVVVKIPDLIVPEKTTKLAIVNHERLMKTAESLLGVRYKIGGESKAGLDCSGFNKYVYGSEGIIIPHSAAEQSKLGNLVNLSKCQAGDLVFFGAQKIKGYKIQHTGLVYANKDGKLEIIHCPSRGVCIEGDGDVSWDQYWKKRFLFIKRLNEQDLLTLQNPKS